MKKVLATLAIAVMLASIAYLILPTTPGPVGDDELNAKLTIQAVATAIRLHDLDTGRAPSFRHGLDSLYLDVEKLDGWSGPYLASPITPKDPWGSDWVLKTDLLCDGSLFSLAFYSKGPNKLDECMGGDDISTNALLPD